MSETKEINYSPTLSYDDSYGVVMNEAISLASLSEGLITTELLLQAVLTTYPECFTDILGGMCVAPKLKFNFFPNKEGVRMSAETHRLLSPYGGVIEELCDMCGSRSRVGAFHIAAALLYFPTPPVREALTMSGFCLSDDALREKVNTALCNKTLASAYEVLKSERHGLMTKIRNIRNKLLKVCCGQDDVIDRIIMRLATFWSTPMLARNGRPLSICLVGGTGTGKTYITRKFTKIMAEEMNLPVSSPLEMTRFSGEQIAAEDMIGRGAVWRDGGKEGALTSRAAKTPKSLLVLENFDKAHQYALSHVDTMLTEGKIDDEFTGKNVSFADNIVILTTSLPCRQDARFVSMNEQNAGRIPHDKMMELICNTISNAPGFSALERNKMGAIRSLLDKVDDIILLNDHDVKSTRHMIRLALESSIALMSEILRVECDMQRLELLFLESLQKIGSANNIRPLVQESIQDRVMQYCLKDVTDPDLPLPETLEIRVDDLPELPSAYSDATPYSDEWVEKRTVKRQQLARRLRYDIESSRENDKLILHFTHLRHIVLPSIEDSEFFSVRLPDVRRSDLVGMDTPWNTVMRALKHIHSGSQTGITPQYGVLLCGPPGTGKTSFAKAVAAELGLPFIYVATSDLCCSNPSLGVKRVQQLFAAAHRTGAIIFLDEVDALGSRDRSHGLYDVVINALLTELDGFNERHVLVLAATNRPEMLDPALTRNGRLHTRIWLGCLTNDADRAELIKTFCATAGVELESSVAEFAVSSTYDWSPANIKALLAHAIESAENEQRAVSRRDIVDALHKEYFGENTQREVLDSAKARHVAVHESGHALVCTLLGIPWVQVTINSGGAALAYLETGRVDANCSTADDLRRMIEIRLAGRAAEELLSVPAVGSSRDFEQARILAGRIIDERLEAHASFGTSSRASAKRDVAIERIIKSCMSRVRSRLADHRHCLETIVSLLLKHRVLLQSDVATVLASGAESNRITVAAELPQQ